MRGRIGDKERLGHIFDCILEISSATKDVSKEEFIANHILRMAVVKWLEIIGEAANNITVETRERASNIVWEKIIGFRHLVVHEYFGIDFMIVWKLLSEDVVFLEQEVQKLLNAFE